MKKRCFLTTTSWAGSPSGDREHVGSTCVSGPRESGGLGPRAPAAAPRAVRGASLPPAPTPRSPEAWGPLPPAGPGRPAARRQGAGSFPPCAFPPPRGRRCSWRGRRLCPEPFLVPKPPVKTGSDEAEFALPLQRATFLFSFCHSSLGISTCGRLPCSLPVPAALDVLGVHNAAPRGHRQGGHRMARRLPQAHGNRSG